ncbi:MAG: winged helix-turn-helix transcriptional regulator [Candidatus Coatesbacteria bacterium]
MVVLRRSAEFSLKGAGREKSWEELERGLGDKLGENRRKMLQMIHGNPRISTREIARAIGISDTAIENHLAALKKTGLLRRIGPDKGGHWEIQGKKPR